MKLKVKVEYKEEELEKILEYADSVQVWAQNPNTETAETYLQAGYTNADRARQAVVIAQKESNVEQFTYRENCNYGAPLISIDGYGVGMMQITNPSPVPQDYWNWRANVDHGKEILQMKWDWATNWFNQRVAEGWPEPTIENYLYGTYCLYNIGWYYSNIEENGVLIYVRNVVWANECGAGRCQQWYHYDYHLIEEKCKQSGCCYADDAMRIH